MPKHFAQLSVAAVAIAAIGLYACVEPPPKIASIPSSGLALRVYTFGAAAEDARRAFQAVKENNKSFSVVREGGDGEVLVGLDNDSPQCVPPTGLCSFKISYRIKDSSGVVVQAATTSVTATSEHCSDLCSKALNNVAVRVVEAASAVLKPGGSLGDASVATLEGADLDATSTALTAAAVTPVADAPVRPPKPASKKDGGAQVGSKNEPAICSVGHGLHLESEEAERRAAQVEVLKRLSIIEQDEYDCLRKAYLDRL
ncbi:MAG: hypothetical protein ABIP39_12590 [Polyangiaceae bacterium]